MHAMHLSLRRIYVHTRLLFAGRRTCLLRCNTVIPRSFFLKKNEILVIVPHPSSAAFESYTWTTALTGVASSFMGYQNPGHKEQCTETKHVKIVCSTHKQAWHISVYHIPVTWKSPPSTALLSKNHFFKMPAPYIKRCIMAQNFAFITVDQIAGTGIYIKLSPLWLLVLFIRQVSVNGCCKVDPEK